MATTLEVVNQCLAVMGEAPLNTLAEDHAYKQSALNILERNDKQIQSEGWWFNTEYLELSPNPTDSRIYLPNDTATIRPICDRPDIVQRGRILYDTSKGTDKFVAGTIIRLNLIRRVAFELVPSSVNDYITRKTVLDFQNDYDGDSTKTRDLWREVYGTPANANTQESMGLRGIAKSEHIRYTKVNFIQQSSRLHRITNRIDYSRRPY